MNCKEEIVKRVFLDFLKIYKGDPEGAINRFKKSIDWKIVSSKIKLNETIIGDLAEFLDWKSISKYQVLSESFIREFEYWVNWDDILIYQCLSDEFREEFTIKYFNTEIVCDRHGWIKGKLVDGRFVHKKDLYTDDFIRINKNRVDWRYISSMKCKGESFAIEFKDYIVWEIFMKYHPMSEELIRKCIDVIPLNLLVKTQKLSEKFIEDYLDRLDPILITIHQTLSNDFINRHSDRFDWGLLRKYQKLSTQTLVEYGENRSKIYAMIPSPIPQHETYGNDLNLGEFLLNLNLPENTLNLYAHMFSDSVLYNNKHARLWELVVKYQKLTETFMDTYGDRMGWGEISRYQKLTKEFIIKHKDKVDWWNILIYQEYNRKDFGMEIEEYVSESITKRLKSFSEKEIALISEVLVLKNKGVINL